MRRIGNLALSVPLVAVGLLCLSSPCRADIFSDDKVSLFADFRTRVETDWDSQNSSGASRDDRTRARIRARVGFTFSPTDRLTLGVRARTGSDDSHQSPHITVVDFDDNDTGDADVNLDKWFLKGQGKKWWGWVGRNSLPFWKQDEMFWDDDATPAGLAGGYRSGLGEAGRLEVNVGYLSLPAGMQEFSGNLGLGQLVYSKPLAKGGLTAAVGVLSFDANPDDPDASLLGNGLRDYTVWIASVQGTLKPGNRKLTFGADVIHNAEDYSDTDPLSPGSPEQFTFDNRDETDGVVFLVKLGGVKEKGDWLAGYYYSRIETLAVNGSYAQDDWVRWGSATESRGTNMKGHELRFAYGLSKSSNLVFRLYLVEAITTPEDGNRFRADWNVKF